MIEVTIRERAEKKGIKTAYQLQKAADLFPSVANRLFNSEFKQISLDVLDKLCKALDCQPNQLFRYEADTD